MKMTTIIFGLMLALIASTALGSWDGRAPLATAQATFKVVDTEGFPVTNALVSVGFFHRDPDQSRRFESRTDTNGCATLEGPSSGQLAYWIYKDGCYESSGGYKGWMEKWMPPDSPNIKKGRWQPWNPTIDVVLKEIKNPIPMYVKGVNLGVPEFDKPLGFDLEEGDWVPPYGKGVTSDFIFYATLDKRAPEDSDYRLTLTFQNEKDGIQVTGNRPLMYGSKLASMHTAPVDGYLPKWEQFKIRRPSEKVESNWDQNRIYCFRVRTKLDEQGNIVSALYGKIYGDFLYFTYYLNPNSNDRNIEFDPEKNLFGGRNRFAP